MPILHFKGKPFLKSYHHTVEFHRLVEQREKSLTDTPSLDDNLIIHGDNLKALKALLPTHAGKIKCIYIDPPYNTGNEGWAYNDNVNSPMIQKWLGQVVAKDDLSRHDKWCCMMYPRLTLLRELLRDNGVIFVSIDDNEVHHLRMMMDEIFGEENFLGTIIWEKADSPRMDAEFFSNRHDYILTYCREKDLAKFYRQHFSAEGPSHYDKKDEDGKKYYLKPLRAMGGQGDTRESRPSLYYGIIAPDGSEVFPKKQNGEDGAWRWRKEKVQNEKNRVEWKNGKNGWTPYFRIFEMDTENRPVETIWRHVDVGSNRTAKLEIKKYSQILMCSTRPSRRR